MSLRSIVYVLVFLILLTVPSFSDSGRPPIPGSTDHQVYFENTDHELHVYKIFGKEPGNTVLIIGGIHGNEPGGYLAADKFVDISLRKGNLIVVPRANLTSILSNNRGVNGDYNRKFNVALNENSYDDQVIAVLKELMERSNLLLNLHDGSGFYRDNWVDSLHNPFRFGQSIIADCDKFLSDKTGHEIELEAIARIVVSKINEQIDNERYKFSFANHDSVSPDTKYPEMRKTATFYALTEHSIPAYGIETSKSLPSTEMKVAHQVIAINAFLEAFDVILDMPPAKVEKPKLEYLVITINESEQKVVKDGGELVVNKGDSVKVDHIVGNYERSMYADFDGFGGRNDNGKEIRINRPLTVRVRKDAVVCGQVRIVPVSERAQTNFASKGSSSSNFIIEVNGLNKLIPENGVLNVIRGDKLRIIEFVSRFDPAGINVNFLGFVGNSQDNRGEDRGYLADTSKDLLKNWSVAGDGLQYKIAAKKGNKTISTMTIKLHDPVLEYCVLRKNGNEPDVLLNGEALTVIPGDTLKFLGAQTNAPDNDLTQFKLTDSSGKLISILSEEHRIKSKFANTNLNVLVLRASTVMGTVQIKVDRDSKGK